MNIIVLLVLWEFLQTKFILSVILNLLVNLIFFLYFFFFFFVIFIECELTQITFYHIVSWCCQYLGLFIHSKRKGGHKSIWIVHQDNSNHFTFGFRDDYSEYEDHMDISKCIPSITPSGLTLKDPLEKQVTPASSSFSPKGDHWVGFPSCSA